MLVGRLQLAVGWVVNVKLYHEAILPPMPLVSNAAKHVYNGLYHHPFTARLLHLCGRICRVAKHQAFYHDADGHLGTEKLHAHRLNQEISQSEVEQRPRVLTELLLCQNHQTSLTVCSAVSSLPRAPDSGGKVLQNMYCSTVFLRMGGHFPPIDLRSPAHLHRFNNASLHRRTATRGP